MGGEAEERLQWKEPLHSLEIELQRDFGLSPVASHALVRRLGEFLESFVGAQGGARNHGQIVYSAVVNGERAGKPLRYCLTAPVVLTMLHASDAEVLYKNGSPALRRVRIARLCEEAARQGAALSHEDISLLVGIDLSTVRRLIGECTKEAGRPPTRGVIMDIGPSVTHKEQVLRLFFRGFLPARVAARTGHTLGSVERYLLDFARVAELHRRGGSDETIGRITGMSPGLVTRYLALYNEYSGPAYKSVMERLLRRFGPMDLSSEGESHDG